MMKRRLVIKSLVLSSGALITLPYCSNENCKYSNLNLIDSELETISYVSDFILKDNQYNFPTPDKRVDFILNTINYCYKNEEIKKFLDGFSKFKTEVKYYGNKKFNDLSIIDKKSIISNGFNSNDNLNFFFENIKSLSLRHFTTSENYMKNYLNYEFIPNRYLGTIKI